MLVQTYFPRRIAPQRYDQYLAAGWFRGANMLYKTDILCLDQDIFSVINIRLNLHDYQCRKSHRKIIKKNQERFRTLVQPLRIDAQRERLYKQHKSKFKGFIHDTLAGYLHGGDPLYVFRTFEVAVYDGKKLVGWSCFDVGQNAIASLLGLYDQEYSSYSLGTYTMLMELNWAHDREGKWYYPGYILGKSSNFDYKLELGNFQHYNQSKRWVNFDRQAKLTTEAEVIKQKTFDLLEKSQEQGLNFDFRVNPYFTMAYLAQWEDNLEGAPLFVQGSLWGRGQFHFWYDINHGEYCLNAVSPARDMGIKQPNEAANEYDSFEIYSQNPWRVTKCLCRSVDPQDLLDCYQEMASLDHYSLDSRSTSV